MVWRQILEKTSPTTFFSDPRKMSFSFCRMRSANLTPLLVTAFTSHFFLRFLILLKCQTPGTCDLIAIKRAPGFARGPPRIFLPPFRCLRLGITFYSLQIVKTLSGLCAFFSGIISANCIGSKCKSFKLQFQIMRTSQHVSFCCKH